MRLYSRHTTDFTKLCPRIPPQELEHSIFNNDLELRLICGVNNTRVYLVHTPYDIVWGPLLVPRERVPLSGITRIAHLDALLYKELWVNYPGLREKVVSTITNDESIGGTT